MWIWQATIRVPSGVQKVTVKAAGLQDARYLIEQLYGKGCIQGNVVSQIRRADR